MRRPFRARHNFLNDARKAHQMSIIETLKAANIDPEQDAAATFSDVNSGASEKRLLVTCPNCLTVFSAPAPKPDDVAELVKAAKELISAITDVKIARAFADGRPVLVKVNPLLLHHLQAALAKFEVRP